MSCQPILEQIACEVGINEGLESSDRASAREKEREKHWYNYDNNRYSESILCPDYVNYFKYVIQFNPCKGLMVLSLFYRRD